MNLKKNTTGHSLLETIIYVSLLIAAIVIIMSAALGVYRVYGALRVDRALVLNGDLAMETMIRTIRSTQSTDVGASVFGLHPGVLKVDDKKFFLSGSILQLQDGVSASQNLTSGVVVTNLIFYRAATNTPSEVITISLTLQGGGGAFLKTKNFYGSVVLRGAY